jgi:threonyl-tRNA synthetase
MPERFDLTYTDKDNKKQRPIMIHRAILGSFERFIGILLEHLNGNFPTWLAPVQCRVLSFTDRNKKAVEKLAEKLKQENIRADTDTQSTTVSEKVRNAEIQKIPYIITIGDKEEKAGTLAIRKHGQKKLQFGIKPEHLIKQIHKEVSDRK